jgi:Flp pilus assembly pilin Flp
VTIADTLRKLLIDDTGATAIEYALIAAAMGACLIPALSTTTDGVGIVYTRIKDLFSSPVVAL